MLLDVSDLKVDICADGEADDIRELCCGLNVVWFGLAMGSLVSSCAVSLIKCT